MSAVASVDLVTASPEDTVLTALETMLREEIDHLPVVDADGRLVGLCTRSAIFKVHRRRIENESRQPGWRPALREIPPDPES